MTADRKLIPMGRIVRAHGVHGAVLVLAYGQDPSVLLAGRPVWLLPPEPQATPQPEPQAESQAASPTGPQPPKLLKGLNGKVVAGGLIVKLKGCSTREAAAALRGWQLALARADLAEPEPDEYYLADLLHLEAITVSGLPLGRVENFLENGAGVVLVIVDSEGRERLVPFSDEHVPEVDLAAGRLSVAEPPGLLD
ncbi:MAG: ribosome maturation factor RimM [Deltaproteobacteria bacterium]|jgi:16S rRNA processing protein RimM|nr:ribosome maturation factor RimM [Deltaproteobacteria bacterium]